MERPMAEAAVDKILQIFASFSCELSLAITGVDDEDDEDLFDPEDYWEKGLQTFIPLHVLFFSDTVSMCYPLSNPLPLDFYDAVPPGLHSATLSLKEQLQKSPADVYLDFSKTMNEYVTQSKVTLHIDKDRDSLLNEIEQLDNVDEIQNVHLTPSLQCVSPHNYRFQVAFENAESTLTTFPLSYFFSESQLQSVEESATSKKGGVQFRQWM